jgi:hypothetical protein
MNTFLGLFLQQMRQSGMSRTEVKKAAALARVSPDSVRTLLDRIEKAGDAEE